MTISTGDPVAASATGPVRVARAVGHGRSRRNPLLSSPALLMMEAAVAFAAALVLPFLVRRLNVNPLDRSGQVSGLAAIQLRFGLIGIVLVAVLLLALRLRGGRHFPLASRFAAAALAGLASGFVAAGAVVALLGTPWPMFGLNGDSGRIVEWSAAVAHGLPNPSPIYPPLPLYSLGFYADWFHGGNTAYAFKDLQILGAAAFGPLTYLAWRMVFSPIRALAFGVLPAFALIDSYKPYGQTVLAVLVPVLVALIIAVKRSGEEQWRTVLLKGAGLGALLGVLFLTYSGWFVWSAGGVAVATALFFPWKTGPRKGLAFVGTTALAFALVAGWYVVIMLRESATTKDYNKGFDAYTDPAYFPMWRTDMPGQVGQWPLQGELGGVQLFTILVFICMGVVLWLGLRKPLVVTVVLLFVSPWLMRMYFASQMYITGEVQLWIRTGNQLLYCGLLLGALTAHLISQQLAERSAAARLGATADPAGAAPRVGFNGGAPLSPQAAVIGAMCGLLFLLGTVGSSMSDRYMPTKENTYKILPWVSHTVRKLDGTCPKYAPGGQCSKDGDQTWLTMIK